MSEPPPHRKLLRTLLPSLAVIGGAAIGWLNLGRNPDPGRAPARIRATMRRGEIGAGGYHGVWPSHSPDGAVAEHIEFQYGGMAHQADTALSGMWLFLATELLFFGGLFLLYIIYRAQHPTGFALASAQTEWLIGTLNTVLLLTSSATFAYGLGRARLGDNTALFRASIATLGLGVAFLLLKAWEWHSDLGKGLFPGAGFAGTGPDPGGQQLFWCYYWIATGLHGLHMIVGVGLVGGIARRARQARYTPAYFTPVEIVGLYWSFVDMVWMALYPTIYLVGRVAA